MKQMAFYDQNLALFRNDTRYGHSHNGGRIRTVVSVVD